MEGTMKKTKAELEQENASLKQKIADNAKLPMPNSMNREMSIIDKIRSKGRVDTGTITLVEKVDHKNISLWTKWGKRIGPLHPYNAEVAYKRFWRVGVELLVDQPDVGQIKDYNESPEGVKRLKAVKASRDIKEKSRGSKSVNKMVEQMAQMTGKTVEAINTILASPQSLAQGRSAAKVTQATAEAPESI